MLYCFGLLLHEAKVSLMGIHALDAFGRVLEGVFRRQNVVL